MVPEDLHDFFVASAGVAGALIGLLFVALTIASDRLARTKNGGQFHRIRAVAALTAFTNALVVSLLALVPGHTIGPTATAVASTGLLFVLGSLLSLVRLREVHWRSVRDGVFLVGLVVLFTAELVRGVVLDSRPGDTDSVDTIAILVAICFLVGIGRAWDLVGGPSIGLRQEVVAMVHGPRSDDDPPAEQSD